MRNKIFIIVLILLAIIIASVVSMTQSTTVMSKVQVSLTEEINKSFNGTVAFERVKIDSLNSVALHDLVVRDSEGNMAISVKELKATFTLRALLTGNPSLAALREIQLIEPQLHLLRSRDGRWNVETLLRDEPGQQEASLSALITLNKGALRLAGEGTDYIVANINGTVDCSRQPTIEFNLSGAYQNEAVSFGGTLTGKNQLFARIKAPKINLEALRPLFPASSPVLIRSGQIADLTTVVRQQQGQLTYAGEAEIRQAALDINGIPVQDTNGRVTFTDQSLHFYQVSGTVAGQKAAVHGRITLNTLEPIIDLSIQASALDIGAVASAVPVTGKAEVKVHAIGAVSNPSIDGTVQMKEGTMEGIAVHDVKGQIRLADKVLTVSDGSAQVFGGRAKAAGQLNLTDLGYYMKLEGIGIDLGSMGDLAGGASGLASFDILVTGKGTAKPALQGTATVKQALWSQWQAEEIDAGFSYTESDTIIDFINIKAGSGTLTAKGNLNDGALRLSFIGQSLLLERFSDMAGIPWSGQANMRGMVTGTVDNPVAEADFNIKDGKIFEQFFTDASGRLVLTKDKVTLHQVATKSGVTTHQVNGTVELTGQKQVNISVRTSRARAETLIGLIAPGEQLTGNIDNEMVITGPLSAWNMEGKVKLWDGSFRGQLISRIEGRYRRAGGIMTLENFVIQSLGTQVVVGGTVSGSNELDLDVKAENIDLAKFAGRDYPMAGLVNFHGHLGGLASEPSFDGELTAAKISLNRQEVTGINGIIRTAGNRIHIERFGFNQNGGTFAFAGGFESMGEAIYGTVTVHNGQLGSLLAILNSPVKEIEGPLNGHIEIGGTLNRPNIAVKGNLYGGKIKNYSLDSVDLDADYTGGVVHINTFSAKQGLGTLAVRGNADLKGDIAMEIGGQNIDASLLTAWFDSKLETSGKLTFGAEVNGKTADPQVALSIDISGGKVSGTEFDSLYGLVTMNKGSIFVNQVLLLKGPYKASAYGTIPLAALSKTKRAAGGDQADQMALQVTLDNANLSVLPMLSKEVSWATGETDGEIRIGGTLYEPIVNGRLFAQDGTVKLKSLSQPFQKVNIDIQFEGDTMNIKTFSGAMGGGSFRLSGSVGWQGLALSDYELALSLDKLGVNHRYFKGPLQGNISLKNNNNKPLLSGSFLFENTTIDIPLIPEIQPSDLDLALDVELIAGKKVRLYNNYLYDVMVEGQAKFTGTTRRPRPTGRFSAIRGTVNYLRTPFVIRSASVDFTQFGTFIPVIHLDASTRLEKTTVNLGIHGPMQAMEMKFSAEPAMRQEEIMSLLTLRSRYFDKSRSGGAVKDSGLGRDEVIGLLDAGLQMRFISEMESSFRQAFGLDEFRVVRGTLSSDGRTDKRSYDPDSRREVYNVEFAKYLTERLKVSYSLGLDHQEYITGLQYDIRRNISFTGSYNSRTGYRVGLETRFSF